MVNIIISNAKNPFEMTFKVIIAIILCIQLSEEVIGATTRRHLDMIRLINVANLSWTADMTPEASRGRKRFGTVLEDSALKLEVKEANLHIPNDQIPAAYNVTDVWPQCTRISHPRNQGECRSDWAVTAASVLTDRICIYLWGLFNQPLSGFHVLTCCTQCGDGCSSGSAVAAWQFFQTAGVVTGGDRHSQIGCLPYQLDPCDYRPTSSGGCSFSKPLNTPACPLSCIDDRYNLTTDRIFVNRSYVIQSDVQEIQKEIIANGPVQASMMVYEDFMYYTGKNEEVYYHYVGELLGGMSVKIIGWGSEAQSGTDYWLVVNSWGSSWGLGGLFRIRRGTDECGIESNVIAGDPSLDHSHPFAMTSGRPQRT
uniref:Cathepsin B-like cysteine proteinase 4 n=1 Tax=Lygus hesperus TaxID=30085 RepID=A0A0A9WWJ7_LYGHE